MTNPQTEARAIVRSASPTVRKLFDAIRESGSSEPDIADAAGVSHATLHYWRAGNRSPTIMLLEAVASVLGYNIELVKADHATALAAKDAELAVLRAELNDCASEIHELRAQLAEARKALANYDRWLNGRDAYIVQKGLWQNFVASLPGSPTAREGRMVDRLKINDAERAIAERAGGVKVPIGYALVPVEPTDRMVSAYVAAKPKGAGFNHPRKGDDKKAWFAAHEKKCRERWKAMLSVSALTTEPAAPEERQEAVAWQHMPGCGEDRESKMVSVSEGAFCDPCIAPLVAALNTAGIETVASCCGHGHRPGVIALRDGRELFIAKDFNEARQIDAIFPIDINGNTRPAEQAVTDEMVGAAEEVFFKTDDHGEPSYDMRAALKAAMEAGR